MTTPSGFIPGRFEDYRADTVETWKAKFGPDANTASDTQDGLLIDIVSIFRTRYAQQLARVYNNAYFGSAEGLHLDNILALFNSRRQEPAGSTVEAIMFGNLGVVVDQGSLINSLAGDAFALNAQQTIQQSLFVVFTFGPADTTPTIPKIQIAGFDYDAAAQLGTGLEIAQALATSPTGLPPGPAPHHGSDARITRWWDPFEDAQGNGVIVVELVANAPFAAFASESDAAQWYGDPALFTSEQNGRIEGPALTITRVGTSTPGWIGVVNLVDATPGRLDESNSLYRLRHIREVGAIGSATPRSLAATLRRLTGVEFARVYMNTTNMVDAEGRPPKSFEAVIEGGSSEEIAVAIWNQHTTGTESYGAGPGATTVTINDPENGELRQIHFTRPERLYMWVEITITKGEAFPATPIADLTADVSTRILEWGLTKSVGFDVYLDEAKQQVNIPGSKIVVVKLGTQPTATTTPPTLSGVDLIVGVRQLTRWSKDRISVVVVP